jgi:hypothetical protein
VRAFVCALAVIAAAGAARADDPYPLPPVGTQLTYRLVSTTKIPDKSISITFGQIYTYVVATADSPTIAGTIKQVALIYGCSANATDKDCAFANKMGAKRDGDLVTLPVPDTIADGLAKESGFKVHYFINEERKLPLPGAKNPDDPGIGEFGTAPVFVLTNKLVCDYTQLKDFLPFGKTPHLALPCHNIFSRTQARVGNTTDQNSDEAGSMELTYDGVGRVSLPSGEWDVQKVKLRFAPSDASHPAAQSEFDVATKLGVAVRVHTAVNAPATHVVSESTSELIAVKP